MRLDSTVSWTLAVLLMAAVVRAQSTTPTANTTLEAAPKDAGNNGQTFPKGPQDLVANFRRCGGPQEIQCPPLSVCQDPNNTGFGFCVPTDGSAPGRPTELAGPPAPAKGGNVPKGPENLSANFPRCGGPNDLQCPQFWVCQDPENDGNGVCIPTEGARPAPKEAAPKSTTEPNNEPPSSLRIPTSLQDVLTNFRPCGQEGDDPCPPSTRCGPNGLCVPEADNDDDDDDDDTSPPTNFGGFPMPPQCGGAMGETCPEGFTCQRPSGSSAGFCRPENLTSTPPNPTVCGGPEDITCPRGSRCLFNSLQLENEDAFGVCVPA